jgi:hypothetical protein
MFIKKQPIVKSQNINAEMHRDMIVHNMPSPHRFRPTNQPEHSTMSLSFSGAQPNRPKSNFKVWGGVIMLSGLVLIGLLVYLSYKFIISPSAQSPTAVAISTTTLNSVVVTPTSSESAVPISVATTSLDLSSLASSTVTVATATSALVTTTTSDSVGEASSSSVAAILDSDHDGLTDEEELVLGTSATSTDSDGDTFSDLAELTSGYNPAGTGKLVNNKNLATYTSKIPSLSLLYPKAWQVKSLNNGATIIFTAPDESLIQISVQDNPTKATILSWYGDTFPNSSVTYDKLKDTATWEGIAGTDGLNYYLTDKKRSQIIIFSYIPAVEQRVAYPHILQLMIDSLVLK